MAIKRTCDGCGKAYWSPGADWQHRDCGIRKGAILTPIAAADHLGQDTPRLGQGGAGVVQKSYMAVPSGVDVERGGSEHVELESKPIERKRFDRTAYQREYMRKRRAKK